MTNVWISASYSGRSGWRGQGFWCAPSLRLASQSEICTAVDKDDALRIGAAMAIMSAFEILGDNVVFHLPATPKLHWLRDSLCVVPLGTRPERLAYTTKIDAWLQTHKGGFIVSDTDIITMDLLTSIAPKCADYDMYSTVCGHCQYPMNPACGKEGFKLV